MQTNGRNNKRVVMAVSIQSACDAEPAVFFDDLRVSSTPFMLGSQAVRGRLEAPEAEARPASEPNCALLNCSLLLWI